MIVVFTTAPEAYDYNYCTQIENTTRQIHGREFQGRLVGIPEESYIWQTDRYHSGYYIVMIEK